MKAAVIQWIGRWCLKGVVWAVSHPEVIKKAVAVVKAETK